MMYPHGLQQSLIIPAAENLTTEKETISPQLVAC